MASGVNDVSKVQLIPLWHTVYHDYGLMESQITFCTHSAPEGAEGYGNYHDYYVRGFGLSLVWGEMPDTWDTGERLSQVNTTEEKEFVRFVRRIVQARMSYAKPYLVYGRMLRPPILDVPTFRIGGATRLSWNVDYPPFDEKTVLGSAWKSPRGTTGYIFCNISPDPQSFRLPIAPTDAEFPMSAVFSILENRNGVITNRANQIGLPCELMVEINPLDVLLLEIVPQAPRLNVSNLTTNGTTAPYLTLEDQLFGSAWALERTTVFPYGPWNELTRFRETNKSYLDNCATNSPGFFYRLRLLQ
jgi:hypothetical protein